MTNDFETFRTEFFRLADEAAHILVTAHLSPDDDSIGSVLSMRHVLKKKYPKKNVRVVYGGTRSDRYDDAISNFSEIEFVEDIASALGETDMLVVLDVNNLNRVSVEPEKLAAIPRTVCIDHHASKPGAFTLSCIVPELSSNSELIFRIFEHEARPIEKPLAEALLLGIIGDTGNFSYVKPAQTDAFALGGELVSILGISIDEFRSRYGGIPMEIMPLLKALMANAAYETIEGWPPFQYTYIDRETIRAGGFSDEDVSTATHIFMGQYLKSIRGYAWGFVLSPRHNGSCRVSLRSLPKSVNVRDMMERMALGGGHDRASGGAFEKEGEAERDAKECLALILYWMKYNKPVIV